MLNESESSLPDSYAKNLCSLTRFFPISCSFLLRQLPFHSNHSPQSTQILVLLQNDRRKYIIRILENSFSKKEGYENQIWQRENYPELIESEKFLQQKVEYIHNNPVIKGYVDEPQHYIFYRGQIIC